MDVTGAVHTGRQNLNNLKTAELKAPASTAGFSHVLASKRSAGQGSGMDQLACESPDIALKRLVPLGTINHQVSTVSELLYKSPYKEDCWNIIFSSINKTKPFTKILPGTQVYLDADSNEIVWGKTAEALLVEPGTRSGSSENGFALKEIESVNGSILKEVEEVKELQIPETGSKDLVSAVRQFIGKDYSAMDCYELVVGGLKRIGVQYGGKGGLGEALVRKAVDKGYRPNHYLNGEGIVDASGQKLFNKRIFSIKNPDVQADQLLQEMLPILGQGQILSFSTRSRGHTGIISQKAGLWTFINSGTMDNNLAGMNGRKQVGEENLTDEVRNWFRLARERGEGLMITLGAIDMKKLAAYTPAENGFSEKA